MSDILYAGSHWIGPAHPENYFHGRIGYGIGDAGHVYTVTAIGLHHTATTLQGAIDTFKAAPASGRQHSAHFIVDLDGTRYQMLDTADTAFALGDEAGNCYTVNIEVVQTWDFTNDVKTSDFTDAQYASVTDICRIVAADEGFPPDAGHIHGHNFWTQTTCPADLDIARVIAGTGGGGFLMALTDAQQQELYDRLIGRPSDGAANLIQKVEGTYAAIKALPAANNAAVITELKNIELAIADLKAHPASSDPRLLASITNIEKAAAAAGTALAQA